MESLGLSENFLLKEVLVKMVTSKQHWLAFSRFAVSVMRHKEEA